MDDLSVRTDLGRSTEAGALERAEATLLSALFARPAGARADEIRAALATHKFQNNLHALLFSALQQLPAVPGPDLPARLLALLVRRGFPDVGLQEFLRPPPCDEQALGEALDTVRKVRLDRT